jgi:hypothetical protein
MQKVEFDSGGLTPHKRLGLERVPSGLREIIEYYGDPGSDDAPDPDWYRENTEIVNLPFPMRLSWKPDVEIERIRCHKKVSLSLLDALTEIGRFRGEKWLRANDYDLYGGCFNWRTIRGRTHKLSTHAWAIAIDLNPHLGPLGKQSRMPDFIVDAFVMRNWIWGGDFSRKDAMHFQACESY